MDILPEALEQAGITADDYAEWRGVLAVEEQHLRDVQTLAEIERREEESERRRSLRGALDADDD